MTTTTITCLCHKTSTHSRFGHPAIERHLLCDDVIITPTRIVLTALNKALTFIDPWPTKPTTTSAGMTWLYFWLSARAGWDTNPLSTAVVRGGILLVPRRLRRHWTVLVFAFDTEDRTFNYRTGWRSSRWVGFPWAYFLAFFGGTPAVSTWLLGFRHCFLLRLPYWNGVHKGVHHSMKW